MPTTPNTGVPVSTLPVATAIGTNDRVVVLRPDEPLDKDKLATVAVDLLGSGDSAPFDLTPTENLGGIVAGQNYTHLTPQEYLTKLLVKYQAPGFSAFAFNGQGSRTVPVGTVIPATTSQSPATFTWATTNSQNVATNSITLYDLTGNQTLATGEPNDGTLTVATQGFTVALGESRRYRLTANNSQGASFNADLVINGETESYLGASTAASLTGAQLVTLGNAQLQGSRARNAQNVTTSGGQYLYYAYDSRHGDLTSIILDGAAPVLGAFQKLGDVASTNATGAAVTLRVYRSNAVNAFSNNSLAFS